MLKQALQLRLGQQLTMTPQLQQAIRLLQLPALDLQAHIREALENLGDRQGASTVMQKTEGVARATRIDEFFSFINQRGTVPLPAGDSAPRLSVPNSLPPGKRDTGGN